MIVFYDVKSGDQLGTITLTADGKLVADPRVETFLTPRWADRAAEFMEFYADWSNGYVRSEGSTSELSNPYHDERGRFAHSPHGAVMKPDGGFTFDPVRGRMATKGFAVSPYPERSKVIDADGMSVKEIRSAISDYATENLDLAEKKNHYLGGWRDPADGKVYLDVSIVVKDAAEARKVALEKDQIAYYDFSTGNSVTVNKDAKSGQG